MRTPMGRTEWWLEFALVLCFGAMCFIAGMWVS
jgi:hypothetical protein